MAVLHALRDPFASALCERSASQKPVVSGQKQKLKKKLKKKKSHSAEAQLISHRCPRAEHSAWHPRRQRTPGRRREKQGGDARTDWHPGWDVPPSSPSQNGRIKVSPGLSPEVVVRTCLRQSRHCPNRERTENLLRFWGGGRTGKRRMLFSILRPFAAAACARWLRQDEASPGSEREGRNVAFCAKGGFVQPRCVSQDCLWKVCSVNRDPPDIFDWASFFYAKSQYGTEEAKTN